MRPKFQKRSALKLAGRIIPNAKHCGINDTIDKHMQSVPGAGRVARQSDYTRLAAKAAAIDKAYNDSKAHRS